MSSADAVLVLHGFVARDGALTLWAETDAPARAAAAAELVGETPPARMAGASRLGGDLSPARVAGASEFGGDTSAARAAGGSGLEGDQPAGTAAGLSLPGDVVRVPPAGPAVPAEGVRGAGDGPRGRSVARHPFAVGVAALPAGTAQAPATLLLPSTGVGPLPSPQLGLPPRRGRPRLRPWTVPVVTVPFVDESLADEAGARAAPSLDWLARLSAFAADLVRRGRVLPGVVFDGPGPRARWRPVLSGADAARHADLLRAMPAAARAHRARAGEVTGLPAADALHAALGRLVDDLVRTRLRAEGVTLSAAGDPATATGTGAPGGVVPGGGGARAGGRRPAATRREAGEDDGHGRAQAAAEADADAPAVGVGSSTAPERVFAGWLAALAGEPGFDGPDAAVQALGDVLDAWLAEAAAGAPVRVCFRLTFLGELAGDEPDATGEPVGDGGEPDGWLLEFLVQPPDEPSVLVSAADIWRDRAAPLRRWTHHPQERLLAGLGRAARLYPDLDAALRVARPVELLLDTAGAHRFLSQAGVLAEAGYGILLPAWWREPQPLGLALEVRGRDAVTPVLRDEAADLASIVDYQWGLALGGRTLTEDELTDLARVQVPLVRLRGQWVYLDAERLRAGLDFLSRGGGTMTAGDALRMVRLLPPEELPLPVTATGGKGWLADLLAGSLDERLELVEVPAALVGTLRPYQRRGLSWLVFLDRLGVGACLADDMGLGKTVQLLALELRERRGPTLLICPLSVLGNWQREAARFAPGLTVRVLHGADRPDPAHLVDGCDILLTTYATATRDADALAAVAWDRVVLDEAQHIKNSASAVARAVRRFPARHRVALTGTPVENRLAELWSIMDFLNPGLLASAHTFRARYAVPIERFADEDAATRLRQATRPFLLRRVKADPSVISDLPDKRFVRHLCGLTTEQATLYRAVLDDMLIRLKEGRGKGRNGLVLAAMTKLKQVCNHPAHLLGDGSPLPGRSGKLERLEEILDSVLAAGERALCFTQFTRFGSLLVPHLAARFGVPVRHLHGGTPRGERDALVAAFQADERPGVFVLSLKAGGTGLNLTAANHVVHVDRWWNPATEAQATDRAFRIGQHRDVQVHTLVCLGTLEERIDRLIADKGVLAERVVGTGEGWLSALSTSELRDLLTLAPEAVGD